MSDKGCCTNCDNCINRYFSDDNNSLCGLLNYDYEEINASNAVNVLINPHFSDAQKRELLKKLKALNCDINGIYKDKIPQNLAITRNVNVVD